MPGETQDAIPQAAVDAEDVQRGGISHRRTPSSRCLWTWEVPLTRRLLQKGRTQRERCEISVSFSGRDGKRVEPTREETAAVQSSPVDFVVALEDDPATLGARESGCEAHSVATQMVRSDTQSIIEGAMLLRRCCLLRNVRERNLVSPWWARKRYRGTRRTSVKLERIPERRNAAFFKCSLPDTTGETSQCGSPRCSLLSLAKLSVLCSIVCRLAYCGVVDTTCSLWFVCSTCPLHRSVFLCRFVA